MPVKKQNHRVDKSPAANTKRGKRGVEKRLSVGKNGHLTRHRMFAEAYLDFGSKTYMNSHQSALAAGYSKATSIGAGHKILRHPLTQEAFAEIKAARIKHSTVAGPMEVLETLTQQLRTLPNELMDPATGELIPLDKMPRDIAQAVAGYEQIDRTIPAGKDSEPIQERRTKFKLVDRVKVAEILAKHHGLFEKDNEQGKDDGVKFVAMPTGDLTLAEWTRQVNELNAAKAAEKKDPADGTHDGKGP